MAAAAAVPLSTCGALSLSNPKDPTMSEFLKPQVVRLLKSIETGDPGPVALINPNQYT